ncbi:MAG: DUF4364 family protein [Eubacteriales bacterium]|nr:DUF4364 family protein [Eubacteriales bacterium]
MKDVHVLYKLVILYLLNKVDFALSNGQLCAFIAEEEYTDYFTVQQVLSEMIESGLLRTSVVRNTTLYEMTEMGHDTLEYFGADISQGIRDDVDAYLKKNKMKLRNENAVIADYQKLAEDEYVAHLRVKEKETVLIDLSLNVPTEQQAIVICDQWQKKNVEIYGYLMKELLKNR